MWAARTPSLPCARPPPSRRRLTSATEQSDALMYAAWQAEAAATLLEHKRGTGASVQPFSAFLSGAPMTSAQDSAPRRLHPLGGQAQVPLGSPDVPSPAATRHSTAAVATLRSASK